jgi:hypothetical protein
MHQWCERYWQKMGCAIIMKYFTWPYFRLNVFFLIGLGLLCSGRIQAQSDQTHEFLYIHTSDDGPDNSTADEETTASADTDQTTTSAPHNLYKFIYADFGTSVLNTTINGYTYNAHGLTGAFCGQVGYKIKSKTRNNHMYISAGLELRNLNCSFPFADTFGKNGINHDVLHFWYVGVPFMFQLVNTRHTPGNDNDVNFYIQAGITFSAKISVTESTDDRPGPVDAPNKSYTVLMVHPFLSAGLSYTTKRKICLIGPFVTYNSSNISNQAGYTENLYSYGIRLTALMFK